MYVVFSCISSALRVNKINRKRGGLSGYPMNYGVGRAIALHYIVTLAAWFCSLGHDCYGTRPRRTPAACHKAYDNLYYEISHQS